MNNPRNIKIFLLVKLNMFFFKSNIVKGEEK